MGIKYRVDEKFFDRWNHVSAYVLGYWFADGSLEDASYLRGKYIRVSSTDRKTIEKIKNWLNARHPIVTLAPARSFPNRKTQYLLRIGSHKLYDALTNRGLYPNKSLSIRFPNMPHKVLSDFLRGYFDGDGCVYIERAKGISKPMITKRLTVVFTSGSFDFLQELCNILVRTLSLRNQKVYRSRRAFQLRFSTKESVELFKFLYRQCSRGHFLERKFEIFKKYFSLVPNRIDHEVRFLLEKR